MDRRYARPHAIGTHCHTASRAGRAYLAWFYAEDGAGAGGLINVFLLPFLSPKERTRQRASVAGIRCGFITNIPARSNFTTNKCPSTPPRYARSRSGHSIFGLLPSFAYPPPPSRRE